MARRYEEHDRTIVPPFLCIPARVCDACGRFCLSLDQAGAGSAATTAVPANLGIDRSGYSRAARHAVVMLLTTLALFVRNVDGGTASRSVAGSLARELISAINAIDVATNGKEALGLIRSLLTTDTLNPAPRPPDPGSPVRVLSSKVVPITKAA